MFIPKYRRSILDKKDDLKEIFYQIAEKWGFEICWRLCLITFIYSYQHLQSTLLHKLLKQRSITKDVWWLVSKGKVIGKFASMRYYFHGLVHPRRYEIVTEDGRTVGKFEQLRKLINFTYSMTIV